VGRDLGIHGALVLGVVAGSGADRAGIRATRRDVSGRVVLGDTIIAVEAEPIASSSDLLLALEKHQPGDHVRVTLEHQGRRRDVSAVLSDGS